MGWHFKWQRKEFGDRKVDRVDRKSSGTQGVRRDVGGIWDIEKYGA